MKLIYSLVLMFVAYIFIHAQNTITSWDFEGGNPYPTTGTGTLEKIGGTLGNGSLEFFEGTFNINSFPHQGTNSGTAGVSFSTSTLGYSNVQFQIDLDATNGASRFFEIQYSINGGTNWIVLHEGEHTSPQNTISTFGPYNLEQGANVANLKIRVVTVFREGNYYTPVDSSSSEYSMWDVYLIDNVIISGSGQGADSYCDYNTNTVTPITLVEITDSVLSNPSASNSTESHEFFLDQVAHVYHGGEFTVKLEGNTGGNFDSYFSLFVDWNRNGILDDEGEIYELGILSNSNGTDGNQLIGSFTIPTEVPFGETRMRIISNRNEYALNPCGQNAFGQAEDYVLSVGVKPDTYCTYNAETVLAIGYFGFGGVSNYTYLDATSSQEYFLEKQVQLVRGETNSITLEGNTGGNFVDYYTLFIDWNKNGILDDEGEMYELGTLSNSNGEDENQLTVPFEVSENLPLGVTRIRIIKNRGEFAQNPCGEYEFGQSEDYSLNVSNPIPDEEYCGPLEYEYGVKPITYVNFAGIDNRTSASTSAPDHEYFTEIEAIVNKGEQYELKVEANTDGEWTYSSLTAYIDWNQDGDLNGIGERYELGVIQGSTGEDGQQLIYSVLVPPTALSGATKMRIVKNSGNGYFSIDPCHSDEYGENEESGQAEDYTVIINSDCIEPSLNIDSNSVEACEGTTAILEAETNGGQVFWFSSENATTPIGSGLNFETPVLTETASFWAEATSGEFFEGARTVPQSFEGAQVNQNTNPWGLVFNTNEVITLNSVDVYIADEQGGEVTVQLLNENWDEVHSTTVILPAGNASNPSRFEIPLGFVIPAGNNYRLVMESSPLLVRELSHQHTGFPYELGNSGEITGGTINNGGTNSNYYFFYNWKFNTGDTECKSERVEVVVTVNPSPDAPVGDQIQYFVMGETLADLEVSGVNLTWYVDQNGTIIPVNTPLVDGATYYVSQNNGECESQLLSITVYTQLGVSDSSNSAFAYYPNPVKDILNISGRSNLSKIEIFELSGKQVMTRDVISKDVKLNVSVLNSGVYILKIYFGKTVETFKIIKK